MRATWVILVVVLVGLVVALVWWLGSVPGRPAESDSGESRLAGTAPPDTAPFRIALIPERDIYAQRKRYEALTGYLADKLHRPVRLVTLNTYQRVLQEFDEKHVDAAFMGSLVALLTIDRLKARVLAKPEIAGGISTYRGVFIVPEGSPITGWKELAGRKIAMVKTTTAGDLFPMCRMIQEGVLDGPNPPQIVWVGTHDAVAEEVLGGRVDAGCMKNLRLDVLQADRPGARLVRLETSAAVPNNALVVRAGVADEIGAQLRAILLDAEKEEPGREALARFGAVRFLPCDVEEYRAICEMVQKVGGRWEKLNIAGPPPRIDLGCDDGPTTQPAEAETRPNG